MIRAKLQNYQSYFFPVRKDLEIPQQKQMNNQLNTSQKSNNYSNRWESQEKTQGVSQLEKKRSDFHKQIRKKQIEEIFRAKRKIVLQNIANLTFNEPQSNKKTLMSCLNAISSNEKVDENICTLVNLLALQKPFERYSQTQSNPSTHEIDKYCKDLVYLLLKKLIPNFSNQTKSRINCLNAIANLFADPLCDNVRYVKIVVQTINELYGGIETWGCDQEMIEIYYMIANLQRKTIIQTELLSVEKLLQWGETGIQKLPSDPLKSLTEGFTKLFYDVDEMFNSHHKRSFFTDHFRASREIIIENMIKRLIATGQGNKLNIKGDLSLDSQSLLVIFKFLNKNRVYVLKVIMQWQQDMEDRKKIRQFSERSLGLINKPTLKTTTLREIGNFFINLLRYYHLEEQSQQFDDYKNNISNQNQHNKNTQISLQLDYLNKAVTVVNKQFLTSQPITQIIISICHQSFQCKIIYLKIIHQLLFNIQRSLQFPTQKQLQQGLLFILEDKKLEDILCNFLSEMHSKLRNVDFLRVTLDIYHVVINMTQGKLCLKLKQHVHSLLQSPPEFIPQDIFSIMEELFMLHQEKLEF